MQSSPPLGKGERTAKRGDTEGSHKSCGEEGAGCCE